MLPVGTRLALYTDGLVERRDRAIDDGIDLLAGELGARDGPIAGIPAALVGALVPGTQRRRRRRARRERARGGRGADRRAARSRPEAGAVQQARVVRQASGWRRGTRPRRSSRDAILLVSEIVSNAILHGRPPIELRLRRRAEHLLVEVDDGATVLPAQAAADAGRRARPRAA